MVERLTHQEVFQTIPSAYSYVDKQMAHWSAPVHHLPPKETRPEQKNLHCRGFSEILAHTILGRYSFCV